MLSSSHMCHMQITSETDSGSLKTTKRRLWSNELDLSIDEQARELDVYLAIDPWADELKPPDYQVRASSMRTAHIFCLGIDEQLKDTSEVRMRFLVRLPMLCARYESGDAWVPS